MALSNGISIFTKENIYNLPKIDRSFFLENTVDVACNLLGKIMVFENNDDLLAGRIVETEAYCQNDPACHANKGITPRNSAMFGPAGFSYVYFTYGFHYCLNFVTAEEGIGEAVLIRAVEPLLGIDIMMKNRRKTKITDLCSGPGKLTQAFSINKNHNKLDLTASNLFVVDDNYTITDIIKTTRIGIKEGIDKLWRFYPESHKSWVSKL
ncbi:MAG: DNA-3-methyladenine glycosylase [Armatimonadota bacterium]